MFRLYDTNNNKLGTTDKLNYIRRHDNGCFVLCAEQEATGIAHNGVVYKLPASAQLEGCPEIHIAEVDSAVEIESNTEVMSITFVTMAEEGSIDAATACEHVDLFAEWAYPIAYKVGDIRRYNNILYKCVQAHTSQADWAPDVTASLWTSIADPLEEWPAWSQPVGAHDAYEQGAKVSHNDKHWTSDVANNVWEPGVYGWTQVTEEE